jgi:O-acetyl-ADP-ribose deacetylase (regulator of RNase III)/uncharacterized protein YwgA
MSISSDDHVTLVSGDLLKSKAQALVNTVNCVGVMGKGVALAFKRAYPKMYEDYVRRCRDKEVSLGHPYVFDTETTLIVNFPTKGHWRSVSKLSDIEAGLINLKDLVAEWQIRSIAVPPLGCGNGQLDWSVVGPTLKRHLEQLGIPVDLYVPHGMSVETAQLEFFAGQQSKPNSQPASPKVESSWLALVEILRNVEAQPFHWPVGRIKFQKMAYFATVAGIPTGLDFEKASYGPYAAELKKVIARLQNNGLVEERQNGRMIQTWVGPTFEDIRRSGDALDKWPEAIARVSDLMIRLDTTQCEIAATVHYASEQLAKVSGDRPTASDTIQFVEEWKVRRQPALHHADIARAVVNLASLGWIDVKADESVEQFVEELASF